MRLKILLPFKIFSESEGVTRVLATTRSGSFGLLPQRQNCVVVLSPGILSYSTPTGGDAHLAIAEGVLIKTATDVLVSVRHAVAGTDLGDLRAAVEREFLKLDELATSAPAPRTQLKGNLVRRFIELRRA